MTAATVLVVHRSGYVHALCNACFEVHKGALKLKGYGARDLVRPLITSDLACDGCAPVEAEPAWMAEVSHAR